MVVFIFTLIISTIITSKYKRGIYLSGLHMSCHLFKF